MKLPPFEDFAENLNIEQLKEKLPLGNIIVLPEEYNHDMVAASIARSSYCFARAVIEEYHTWLSEQIRLL